MEKKTKKLNRILVVNVNWLGDVVFSLPVFRALKEAYPQSRLSCLAPPRVQEVLESSHHIDQVILYDEEGRHGNLFGKLKLIAQLRREKFEIAFLLHRSLTRALLVFLAGIPQRVGYDSKKRGFLLTHKVETGLKPVSTGPTPILAFARKHGGGGDNSTHRSDVYLNLIESFGIKVHNRSCELQVDDQSKERIDTLLKNSGVRSNDFLVVVNAGGNWSLKRWPKENFVGLIDRLMREWNAQVVISGGKEDESLARWIFQNLSFLNASIGNPNEAILGPPTTPILAFARKHGGGGDSFEINSSQIELRPIVLAGRMTIHDLLALMKRASLVISADTGPLHLAASVGTPVIGLFGPTHPDVTGPRGLGRFSILRKDVGCNREPCYYLDCPDNVCMKEITVDDVLQEIKQIRNP